MPIFEVDADQDGLRLDVFLSAADGSLTRSQAQKLIREGRVSLNDEVAARPKDPVRSGQKVSIQNPLSSDDDAPSAESSIDLDILFEDEHLLLLNKPSGIVVHEAAGHYGDTLLNGILHHLGESHRAVKGGDRPGIVHRLDKDTTGCMAVAKTNLAYDSLVSQLSDHSAGRTYMAWVWGEFEEKEGTIEAPIGRHPGDRKKMAVTHNGGKDAVTHFTVRESARGATLLEVKLETGRTHQIRVHLSEISHPVVGDGDYGGKKDKQGRQAPIQRQALHAFRLDLKHPATGEAISVEAPLPEDFLEASRVFGTKD